MVVPAEYNADEKETLLSGKPFHVYMPGAIEQRVAKVRGVKKVTSQVFLESAPFICCDTDDAFLVGFNPESDFTILPWVVEKIDKDAFSKHSIITGRDLPYNKGQTIRFYGIDFNIVGTLDRTGLLFIDDAAYMTISSTDEIARNHIMELKPGNISAVFVKTEEEIEPERVAIFIENDIPNVKAIVSRQVVTSARKQLSFVLKGALAVTGIIWLMAIFTIGIVFSMIINERQREIGLLRAMGATRKVIFQVFIIESLFLSLLGGILGVATGAVIAAGLGDTVRNLLKVPYIIPSTLDTVFLIIICITAAIITGLLAVWYPAYRASRVEPYTAIRTGE